MFIFEVVVYRNAVPQPQTTFIQLAVGESIDTAGLIPWVVNPVIDYNVRHEGPLEDSGLYIACDKTDRGAITNVHLRGTAAKVGTYLFLTEAQTCMKAASTIICRRRFRLVRDRCRWWFRSMRNSTGEP